MKWVIICVLIAFVLVLGFIVAMIFGEQIDLFVARHPALSFVCMIGASMAYCLWRVNETFPEWRLEVRFKALIRKIKCL